MSPVSFEHYMIPTRCVCACIIFSNLLVQSLKSIHMKLVTSTWLCTHGLPHVKIQHRQVRGIQAQQNEEIKLKKVAFKLDFAAVFCLNLHLILNGCILVGLIPILKNMRWDMYVLDVCS